MPKRRTLDEESEFGSCAPSDAEDETPEQHAKRMKAEAEEEERQYEACEKLDERCHNELLDADRAWIGTVAGNEGCTFDALQESFGCRSSGFEYKLDHEYYRVLDWRLKMHALRGRSKEPHSNAQDHPREFKYAALAPFRDSIRQMIKNYGDALHKIGYVKGNRFKHWAYAYADVLPGECAMSMVNMTED